MSHKGTADSAPRTRSSMPRANAAVVRMNVAIPSIDAELPLRTWNPRTTEQEAMTAAATPATGGARSNAAAAITAPGRRSSHSDITR